MNAPPVDPPQDGVAVRQAFLTPGTLYCGSEPAIVSTVLGSCVAVCLVDRHNRAAGMNHFVLPNSPAGDVTLRYGDVALQRLYDRMTRLGCDPEDIRAKVFGGAAVLPFGESTDTVGTKNVKIAVEWLRDHSIPVTARRTGGKNGLLIRLYTESSEVLVRKIVSEFYTDQAGQLPTFDSLADLAAVERMPTSKREPFLYPR